MPATARNLRQAPPNLKLEPLSGTDRFYVDLSAARGTNALGKLKRSLLNAVEQNEEVAWCSYRASWRR